MADNITRTRTRAGETPVNSTSGGANGDTSAAVMVTILPPDPDGPPWPVSRGACLGLLGRLAVLGRREPAEALDDHPDDGEHDGRERRSTRAERATAHGLVREVREEHEHLRPVPPGQEGPREARGLRERRGAGRPDRVEVGLVPALVGTYRKAEPQHDPRDEHEDRGDRPRDLGRRPALPEDGAPHDPPEDARAEGGEGERGPAGRRHHFSRTGPVSQSSAIQRRPSRSGAVAASASTGPPPRPARTAPGSTAAHGWSTKARSCARGWGSSRSTVTSSTEPNWMMSMSRVRGPHRSARTRPWRSSMPWTVCRSSRGASVVRARTTALRKSGCPAGPPTATVRASGETSCTSIPGTDARALTAERRTSCES